MRCRRKERTVHESAREDRLRIVEDNSVTESDKIVAEKVEVKLGMLVGASPLNKYIVPSMFVYVFVRGVLRGEGETSEGYV